MKPLEAISKWFGPVDSQGHLESLKGINKEHYWFEESDLTRDLNYDPFVLENYRYTEVDAEYYLSNPGIYLVTDATRHFDDIRFPFHNPTEPPFEYSANYVKNLQTTQRLDISDGTQGPLNGSTFTHYHEPDFTNNHWFYAQYNRNYRGMDFMTNHVFKDRQDVLDYYKNWNYYLLHEYKQSPVFWVLNWANPPNRFIK
jgi:hypothetical protein